MGETYAVIWRVGDGCVCAGRLALTREGFLLAGADRTGTASSETIDSADISSIRIGRARDERIDGRVSLVVERTDGEQLVVASALGVGLIHEIADRLGDQSRVRLRA